MQSINKTTNQLANIKVHSKFTLEKSQDIFCLVTWKCFQIQIMLGIFKGMLIWQRRELCEQSKQDLATLSLAWICVAWMN